jgi:hypothetical protein
MNKPIIYKITNGNELMTIIVIGGIISTTSVLLKEWKGKYLTEFRHWAKQQGMQIEELR